MQPRSGGSYKLREGKPVRVAHSGSASAANETSDAKPGNQKKQKESRDADEKTPATGGA